MASDKVAGSWIGWGPRLSGCSGEGGYGWQRRRALWGDSQVRSANVGVYAGCATACGFRQGVRTQNDMGGLLVCEPITSSPSTPDCPGRRPLLQKRYVSMPSYAILLETSFPMPEPLLLLSSSLKPELLSSSSLVYHSIHDALTKVQNRLLPGWVSAQIAVQEVPNAAVPALESSTSSRLRRYDNTLGDIW